MKTSSSTRNLSNLSFLLVAFVLYTFPLQLEMHYFVFSLLLSLCPLKCVLLFLWCVLTLQVDYHGLGIVA